MLIWAYIRSSVSAVPIHASSEEAMLASGNESNVSTPTQAMYTLPSLSISEAAPPATTHAVWKYVYYYAKSLSDDRNYTAHMCISCVKLLHLSLMGDVNTSVFEIYIS